ncbi:MAG: hypothetical protein ACHREM_19410 [Polyangiales bacterium]
MDWKELGRRAQFIRDLARSFKVQLPVNEGLSLALAEADALASGAKSPLPATDQNAAASAHDAHVIWALADSLEVCAKAGIDLRAHVANMGTGSTDYGTPATANARTIFFKDFEYEVFVMAHFIRADIKVVPAPTPNDPCYEFAADSFLIQLKHPNSTGQLRKQISNFNKCLRERNAQGFFGVGLEDAFTLGDGSRFASEDDQEAAFKKKEGEMETFGRDFLKRAHWHAHVAGVFQTSTLVYYVTGDSTLRRLGNACLFDDTARRTKPTFKAATRIASTFNPKPVLFSEVALPEGATGSHP